MYIASKNYKNRVMSTENIAIFRYSTYIHWKGSGDFSGNKKSR